jgi:hypothetical protein
MSCTQADNRCDICGSEFHEGHFSLGKLWCKECFSGRQAPRPMPPSPLERKQIELWLAPQPARQGARQ